MTGKARLYFSIHKRAVWGSTVPRCFYHLYALAGGGGGSTRGAVDRDVVNNPDETDRKTQYGKHHRHGGPLPVHTYTILRPAKHSHLGLSAQLLPTGKGMLAPAGIRSESPMSGADA